MRWPTAFSQFLGKCPGESVVEAVLLLLILFTALRRVACLGRRAAWDAVSTELTRHNAFFGLFTINADWPKDEGAAQRWVGPGGGRCRARGMAFTLVEMIVVMAIILLLSVLVVPAFNALKGNQDMSTATFDIADTLAQARAYAMGHNTYVFVGFEEVDSAQSTSANPQTAASLTVGGRIAVAVVASRDGTSHYAVTTSSQGSDWRANYASSAAQEYKGGHLVAVNKLLTFDNVHLAASLGTAIPATGGMYRPTPTTTASDSYVLGASACTSGTPFAWPLGSSLNNGQYNFTKVIQFDPQGVERITFADSGSTIAQWTEIDLLPMHGDAIPQTVPTAGAGNQAAIQINGMTGSARVLPPMKTPSRAAAAFTLVEVTLALGVAAFCLITVFGLLPVGLNSNQNAVAQTSAASIARAIVADLHNTPQTNPETSQTSPIYRLVVPASGTATHVLYVSDNGQPLGAVDANANAALNPAYRVTVVFTVPPATTSYFGAASSAPLAGDATVVRILVTWTALADPIYTAKPANYSGSFEVTVALDRTY